METASVPDEPFADSAPQSTSSAGAPRSHPETVFHSLTTYPFFSDPEFQSGLATILGHPDSPASQDEVVQKADLVLQAQCFYFTRKFQLQTPIDHTAYKSWLRSNNITSSISEPAPVATNLSTQISTPATHLSQPTETAITTSGVPPSSSPHPIPTNGALPPSAVESTLSTKAESQEPPEPAYPSSFAAIVDLITRNQPIPGIEEIPDTVLEAGLSPPNTTPRRKKPWEKADTEPAVETEEAGVEGMKAE